MNQFIVVVAILVPLFLIIFFAYRFNQKQIKQVIDGKKTLNDSDVWMRDSTPLQARVIGKKETLNPKAAGIAKVDLELEIQLSQGEPVQVSTCWLVEIPSLPLLEPGKTLKVKFDPKKPTRVYPAVPWAHAWVFGK